MPFIPSTPIPWANLQAEDDPVRAAAEAEEHRVSGWLEAAWNSVARDAVPRIIQANTPERMAGAMRDRAKLVTRGLIDAGRRGQEAMAAQVGLVKKDFSVGFMFDRQSPAVQQQADLHAARFVREIGEDTRFTVNAVMRDAVARGLGPPETARTVRESIGLTISQANAVQNYRRMLTAGDPEAATRALHDPRYGLNVANLSPEQIDARVEAYRRRYVAYRATTIARTETLHASNAGAVGAIQTAVRSGALPGGTKKKWLIAKDERTCVKCSSIPRLQPNGVGVEQPFVWEEGSQSGEVYLPPEHPNCRCTLTFEIAKSL